MMAAYLPSEEFLELLNAVADECLSEDQETRLAEILRTDKQARSHYLDFVAMLTSLQWEYAEAAVSTRALVPPKKERGRGFALGWIVSLAALVLIAVALWYSFGPPVRDPSVSLATLDSAKNARWGSGTLPTEVGSSLGSGRLHLTAGIANIHFVNGAIVRLEAPAELELRSAKHCVLHQGRLMVEVPESAVGFVVDTPTVVLKDLGTAFGVYVSKSGLAEVSVFEGRVDATHRPSGRIQTMQSGENLRFTPDRVEEFLPDVSSEVIAPESQESTDLVVITTGQGRGRDDYIESAVALKKKFRSDTLLLVKNAPSAGKLGKFRNRKAYLRFDLSKIDKDRLTDAELLLTAAPSGIGFASEVSDATFTVYGLTKESEDNWDDTLSWETAPANQRNGIVFTGGAEVNGDAVSRLGTFVIPQGKQSGTYTVRGKLLLQFLKQDTNGLVTVLIVRDTQGGGRNGLVHAFASHRHTQLAPPTLKLTISTEAGE